MHHQNDAQSDTRLVVPRHLAIIMDGNGRWAQQRGLPRIEGHRKGVERVKECVRTAAEIGVEYLTLFSFSSENWRRPQEEVDALMTLIKRFIRQELAELHENNVRVRVIGTADRVDPEITAMIADAHALTAENTGLRLTIAFNYGARDEIARAARRLAEEVARGAMRPEDVDMAALEQRLDTQGLPDPDLLIRTSGEVRLSNFLLWQLAYAELMFVEDYWPDFDREAMVRTISAYQNRERRFGGLSARRTA
ncbi:isoprenyl transferase [Dichotomicrobium thermohalophilum]|uniref:Isoprenyl transferase n=1 Tax=Dichotomicrobium thermohalophilum TaxID=933063 RepID=A0A397Q7G2_9HYPH|nr:isoprenyl transferase [Dichotomicrobium thermohalophilum]RIA56429.1 undecaprenyl diphosphate synthase [Dichotomicrobium thermohalophilum]